MTNLDTAARDAVEGRRRTFPPRPMTGTPDWKGMAERTMLRFPKIMAALREAERQEQRRLRINDDFAVRRLGDRIVASVGALNVELSLEEARRAADALSLFAGTADVFDVEDEPVEAESLGRVA